MCVLVTHNLVNATIQRCDDIRTQAEKRTFTSVYVNFEYTRKRPAQARVRYIAVIIEMGTVGKKLERWIKVIEKQ